MRPVVEITRPEVAGVVTMLVHVHGSPSSHFRVDVGGFD